MLAIRQCESFWGADWYYNPPRWGTADGYVPYREMWAYWYAMEPIMALRRLSVSRAMRIALIRDDAAANRAIEKEQQLASPE